MTIVGIVPAAGRGARFAKADPAAPPKMLAPIDGVPMIRRTVESLLAGGVDRCVVVVAPELADVLERTLEGLPVTCVANPDPSRGMFSSIQCGVRATDTAELCVLLPGDMPYVQPLTVTTVIAAAVESRATVSPRLGGHPGHPLVCSAGLRGLIVEAREDSRLDHELAGESVRYVDVLDPGIRRDVDLPV